MTRAPSSRALSSRALSSRVLPDDLRDGVKASLRRAVVQLGGLKVAAHALGLSLSQTQRLGAAAAPDCASLAQVMALCGAGATAPAEFIAGLAGGSFCSGLGPAQPLDTSLLATVAAAGGLIHEAGAALGDGRVCAAERRDLAREIASVEAALRGLKAALRSKTS